MSRDQIVAYRYRLKVGLVWKLASITQQNSYKKTLRGWIPTPQVGLELKIVLGNIEKTIVRPLTPRHVHS